MHESGKVALIPLISWDFVILSMRLFTCWIHLTHIIMHRFAIKEVRVTNFVIRTFHFLTGKTSKYHHILSCFYFIVSVAPHNYTSCCFVVFKEHCVAAFIAELRFQLEAFWCSLLFSIILNGFLSFLSVTFDIKGLSETKENKNM